MVKNPVIGEPKEIIGAVAQLGERMTGSHEVRGSIPLSSTKYRKDLRGNLLSPFLFYLDFASVPIPSRRVLPKQLTIRLLSFFIRLPQPFVKEMRLDQTRCFSQDIDSATRPDIFAGMLYHHPGTYRVRLNISLHIKRGLSRMALV